MKTTKKEIVQVIVSAKEQEDKLEVSINNAYEVLSKSLEIIATIQGPEGLRSVSGQVGEMISDAEEVWNQNIKVNEARMTALMDMEIGDVAED